MILEFRDKVYSVPVPPITRGFRSHPRVWICPRCLRQWAKLYDTLDAHFCIQVTPCEKCAAAHPESLHPDLCPVGGSLLDYSHAGAYDDELLAALPPELLAREFSLHLKEAECHKSPQSQYHHQPPSPAFSPV